MISTRTLARTVLLALAVVGLVAGSTSFAQDFPTTSITIISPAAAGGGTDLTARNIGRYAEPFLGASVIVSNMPGGGNAIGITAGHQAAPDGYTLVLGQVETVLLPLLDRVPWEASEFTPIIGVNSASSAVTVRADAPFTTMAEFVEYARANPGLQVGGSAPGTIWHLAAVGLDQAIDADLNVIPYSGGAAPAIQDLLGGQLQAVTTSAGEVSDQVEAGNLRVLCIMRAERDTTAFPDVPTCGEEGFDLTFATWWALMAPPNTPDGIATTLREAFTEAWNTAEFQDFLATQGLEPMFVGPEEWQAFVAAETEKFRPIVAELGM
jgi:tripartite-type tricarboxylate transporter receptor subunit TctC